MTGTEFPMDENNQDILKDGTRVVSLSSWQEFHQAVCTLKSKRGYVWRGQTRDEDSEWRLQSKFDREVPTKDRQDRNKKLSVHIENFKREMEKSYPNVLPKDDLDIWALGQHYGLSTPLLDWTLSPYIAAYFAFIEAKDPNDRKERHRYVYALNRSLERLLSKRKRGSGQSSKERYVRFIENLPHNNPRFVAQKGVLTQALRGKDITECVKSFSKKRKSELLIVKFKIPTRDREECLRDLHLMNIDHTSLLLDLRDIVGRCNDELQANRAPVQRKRK
jgi:FRG domain